MHETRSASCFVRNFQKIKNASLGSKYERIRLGTSRQQKRENNFWVKLCSHNTRNYSEIISEKELTLHFSHLNNVCSMIVQLSWSDFLTSWTQGFRQNNEAASNTTNTEKTSNASRYLVSMPIILGSGYYPGGGTTKRPSRLVQWTR